VVDAIELRDLRVMAFCGVLPEEESRRQPFAIDLDVYLDLRRAGQSDDLADTLDYGSLVASVAELARDGRYQLLERFAADIATAVLADARVERTRVSVRKLRPPVAQDLGTSGVSITRGRG